jgi:hypothetical protein
MAQALAGRTSTYGIATGAFVEERDDWPLAIARARDEGWRWIELTAMGDRLPPLVALLDKDPGVLDRFDRISVHAPAKTDASPAEVIGLVERLQFDVVLHPDVFGRETACARLGARAVFENMDVTKGDGRDVTELAEVFAEFPASGFCLDVAHVWTNDPTLQLGHELIDAFGDRLRQLHVSGIEPDGTHRPTTAVDIALYEPLLDCCVGVPWLLETELVEDTA